MCNSNENNRNEKLSSNDWFLLCSILFLCSNLTYNLSWYLIFVSYQFYQNLVNLSFYDFNLGHYILTYINILAVYLVVPNICYFHNFRIFSGKHIWVRVKSSNKGNISLISCSWMFLTHSKSTNRPYNTKSRAKNSSKKIAVKP